MTWETTAKYCPWRQGLVKHGIDNGFMCKATSEACRPDRCGPAHFEATMLADELHAIRPERAQYD